MASRCSSTPGSGASCAAAVSRPCRVRQQGFMGFMYAASRRAAASAAQAPFAGPCTHVLGPEKHSRWQALLGQTCSRPRACRTATWMAWPPLSASSHPDQAQVKGLGFM